MKYLNKQYNSLKSNTKAKQSLWLLIINFSGLPLGVATSILLAKMLGAEGFGNYNFFLSVFTFSSLIITLGFFQAGNRALVLNNNKKIAKKYYGAMLVILFLLFVLLSIVLALYGLTDSNLKNKKLTNAFLASLPLGLVFLSGNYVETLLQADNRISLLSFYRLSTKFLYLLTLVALYSIKSFYEYSLVLTSIYCYFITYVISFSIVLCRLNPDVKQFSSYLNKIWIYNKSFGLNIYIGSVLAVGFVSLSQILISYFSDDNSSVGFYILALTFCAPLSLIPNTIATVYYKDFSTSLKISNKILKTSLLLSLVSLIFLWLVIKPFVIFFYGEDFKSVVNLSYIVSLGVLAHSYGDMYNRFLGANGQSIALRNSAIIVGITSVVSSFYLIPFFGVYGAVATNLVSGFLYLYVIRRYYKSYISSAKVN